MISTHSLPIIQCKLHYPSHRKIMMLVSLLQEDTEEKEIINYVRLGYVADGNVKNSVSALKDEIYIFCV